MEYGQSVLSKTSLFWTNLHNKDAIKFALKGEIIACWQIINVIIKFTSLSYELRRRAIVLPHSIQPKIVGVILNEIMIRYKIYLMAYIMCEIYQVCQIVGDHTINPIQCLWFCNLLICILLMNGYTICYTMKNKYWWLEQVGYHAIVIAIYDCNSFFFEFDRSQPFLKKYFGIHFNR